MVQGRYRRNRRHYTDEEFKHFTRHRRERRHEHSAAVIAAWAGLVAAAASLLTAAASAVTTIIKALRNVG